MEPIAYLLVFALGLGTGHYLWPRVVKEVVVETQVVKEVQTVRELFMPEAPEITVPVGRRRVIFRFANGFEDRKTLFQHSVTPTVPWKGKLFAQAPGEGPAVVYNEVVWPQGS